MNNEFYKLTKVGIKNADSRAMNENDAVTGLVATVTIGENQRRLLVGNYYTSVIVKYEEQVPGKSWLVETQNSVYTLEKM